MAPAYEKTGENQLLNADITGSSFLQYLHLLRYIQSSPEASFPLSQAPPPKIATLIQLHR